MAKKTINCIKFENKFNVGRPEILRQVSEIRSRLTDPVQYLVLCDENTTEHCLPLLNLPGDVPVFSVKPGETFKSLDTLETIWRWMVNHQADRQTVLLNLGGGVITDMGGLAASLYMRGIRFIHIPTTLMGMVDAAHGGKTGVNFDTLKNYIGTFTLPQAVWVWPGFLSTLPKQELTSGFAEMVKHGLIRDAGAFHALCKKENQPSPEWTSAAALIERSIEIKWSVVEEDFKESGWRQILNFGHTIGHAMESAAMGNGLPHGYYVAAGMICETWISMELGVLDISTGKAIIDTLNSLFPRIPLNEAEISAIKKLVRKDKKNRENAIVCVLLNDIGTALPGQMVPESVIDQSLDYYRTL